jgi:hypothetical protein
MSAPQPEVAALRERAVADHRAGRLEAAAEGYRRVLARMPGDWQAWNNLGVALRRQEKFPAALACYRRALELKPDDPGFLGNLGNVLKDLGRMDEAVAAHRKAVEAKAGEPGPWHNLGIALREAGAFAESVEALDRALALNGEKTVAWDRAISLLHGAWLPGPLHGRWAEGWAAYEARWVLGELPDRRPELARWQGEDLAGKTVLVLPEQGFGDTLLAARFLPLLAARGAAVWLEAKPAVAPLFAGNPHVARLVRPDEPVLDADFRVFMMSLPGLLGVDGAAPPPPAGLAVPAKAAAKAEVWLAPVADARLKVGIVWSGSVTFKGNRLRAVPLERFLPLAEIPGVRLVSLQKGPPERELADTGAAGPVLDLGGRVADFAETAAILKRLDLVVMTDSAVAHLAGSLGVPVWNLLNFVPYWLYGTGGDSTPWYPSMRLIRQPAAGDWDSVFARARGDLAERARQPIAPAAAPVL